MATPEMDRNIATGRREIAPLRRFTPAVLTSDNVVPVVLEFEQPPVAVFKRLNPQVDATRYEAELIKAHQEFVQHLTALGMDVQVGKSNVVVAGANGTAETVTMTHDFTQVFNGLGVLMPGRVVANVAQMTGVRAVTLNQERVYLNAEKNIPFTGAPQVWERVDTAGRNIRGEGVTVAVIDTGIDWTHPAFGGYAQAPNDKVVYAVSFTGENPIDNFGHGSHVAGIIAGDMDYKNTPRGDSQINGMAPKAKLMGYKVLSASGSGSATNIILAMEDAVKRGAQVMNLSLGDSFGDPQSPECSSANNAMQAGVIVCIAAGNAGPEPSSVGAPGAAHYVITVGASTDDGVTALMAQLTQEGQPARNVEMRLMEGSAALSDPAVELTYVGCGQGLNAGNFPSTVAQKIALVERGEITFREKALNAQQAGAVACIIYNNHDGNFFGSLGEEAEKPTIPVVSISKADGELLLQAIAGKEGAQGEAKIRLSPDQVSQADHLAEFSSRGPNNDGWIKPELTAPGVNITSATITQAPYPGGGMPDASGYTVASGTSMATPHVAGAAALIRQAHPDWNSFQVKAALVNTARWMPGQGGVMDQGNGAMDLLKAIDCQAILVTATDPINPTHSFGQIVHQGKEASASQALTIQSLVGEQDANAYKVSVEVVGQPEGVTATLVPGTAACNGTTRVACFDLTVSVDGTKAADSARYGFVTAEATWGTLRLPFYFEVAKEASSKPTPPQQQPPEGTPGRRIGSMPCC